MMQSCRLFVLASLIGCGPAPISSDKPPHAPVQDTRARVPPTASASAPQSAPPPEIQDDTTVVCRGVLGHRVKRTPDGTLVVLDAAGGRILALGSATSATFDSTGKLLYTWSNSSTGSAASLYDVVSAKKIAERTGESIEAASFTSAGNRIIEVGEGLRFVAIPSLQVTFRQTGGHSELHLSARRALTLQQSKGQADMQLRLVLVDIDAEKVVGSIPMNEAIASLPRFAFSADGKKMSWTAADTSVWDTTTNKIVVLERGDAPEHPRYEPSAAYFAPDGNSVCIEQSGATRAISIRNVPKGRKRHCFIAVRPREPWISDVSTSDMEAILVDIPVTPGTEQRAGMTGLYYRVIPEAMQPARSMVAVMEQATRTMPNGLVERWLLLARTSTGDVMHRLALPAWADDLHQLEVSFSADGKTVSVWNGDVEQRVTFDVETGLSSPNHASLETPK